MRKIGKLSLTSPLIIASGPQTAKAWQIEEAEKAGAGAVSLKLAFKEVPIKSQFRSYSIPSHVIAHCVDRRLTAREEVDLIREAKKRTAIPLFANFSAMHDRLDEWVELAQMFEEAGADALELNFCCPNLNITKLQSTKDVPHAGSFICHYPEISGEVAKMVTGAVKVPVVCKIVPGTNLLSVAKEIAKAGANAVHIVGEPVTGLPPVDIKSGAPRTPFVETVAYGATNGPVCRYSTFAVTARLASAVTIPIIASGGIETLEDVVSVMMWGASFPSMCSAVIWYGFDLIKRLNEKIERYCEECGLSDVSEIVGKSLEYFVRPDEVELKDGEVEIDREKCTACGRCLKVAHCDALSFVDEKAAVDLSKCIRCGVCRALCPVDAISYDY
jgi:dihydroorotate dehydrogenase/Pyruvate/2-oxoacid:ferredoxin oxidoreductase delta subunit